MDSTLLLIHLNKSSRKRKVLHPGLPSRRKKISSDSFTFLISCMVGVVVWVSLVFYALFVCKFLCFVFYFIFIFNKKGKVLKNTKIVCVCVYWYVCTFGWPLKQSFSICITCSLDEHLHAQLSNVSFVAHLCGLYDLFDLLSFIS